MLSLMNLEQLFVSFSFLCAFTFICGCVADRIMGYAGFGPIGNWLILLAGTYMGMYGFNKMGYWFQSNPTLTIAVVAGVASTLLLFCAMLRTTITD